MTHMLHGSCCSSLHVLTGNQRVMCHNSEGSQICKLLLLLVVDSQGVFLSTVERYELTFQQSRLH